MKKKKKQRIEEIEGDELPFPKSRVGDDAPIPPKSPRERRKRRRRSEGRIMVNKNK